MGLLEYAVGTSPNTLLSFPNNNVIPPLELWTNHNMKVSY